MKVLFRTLATWLLAPAIGVFSVVFSAGAMDKVSVRMDVFFHGPHAPFFLGIEKGFYKEQNIDLSVHPGSGSGTVIKLIGNKNDDFAYADGATLVKAISEGVPAKMVMGLLQSSPMVIVALKESGISKPADLPGKRMAGTPGSAPELMFPAFCKVNRIDCTGVNSVQVDIPGKTAALLSRRVQATFVYAVTQVPMIEDQVGGPINVIRYAEHGVNLLSNGIVTNNDTVEKKPDLVRRFVRATVKSWQYAIDRPDEAVAAFGRVTDKPKASVVMQQLKTATTLLSTPRTKGKPLGWMSADDWRETIGFLEEYGGVPKGIAPDRIFTNAFLEAK
jgi:NitT/TauT family transport system substrate-binding protein